MRVSIMSQVLLRCRPRRAGRPLQAAGGAFVARSLPEPTNEAEERLAQCSSGAAGQRMTTRATRPGSRDLGGGAGVPLGCGTGNVGATAFGSQDSHFCAYF